MSVILDPIKPFIIILLIPSCTLVKGVKKVFLWYSKKNWHSYNLHVRPTIEKPFWALFWVDVLANDRKLASPDHFTWVNFNRQNKMLIPEVECRFSSDRIDFYYVLPFHNDCHHCATLSSGIGNIVQSRFSDTFGLGKNCH